MIYWHVDDVEATSSGCWRSAPRSTSRSPSAARGSSPRRWSTRSATSSASCTTRTTWRSSPRADRPTCHDHQGLSGSIGAAAAAPRRRLDADRPVVPADHWATAAALRRHAHGWRGETAGRRSRCGDLVEVAEHITDHCPAVAVWRVPGLLAHRPRPCPVRADKWCRHLRRIRRERLGISLAHRPPTP